MKSQMTRSNVFYLVALVVLLIAVTTYGGWVGNIYDHNVATTAGHR